MRTPGVRTAACRVGVHAAAGGLTLPLPSAAMRAARRHLCRYLHAAAKLQHVMMRLALCFTPPLSVQGPAGDAQPTACSAIIPAARQLPALCLCAAQAWAQRHIRQAGAHPWRGGPSHSVAPFRSQLVALSLCVYSCAGSHHVTQLSGAGWEELHPPCL